MICFFLLLLKQSIIKMLPEKCQLKNPFCVLIKQNQNFAFVEEPEGQKINCCHNTHPNFLFLIKKSMKQTSHSQNIDRAYKSSIFLFGIALGGNGRGIMVRLLKQLFPSNAIAYV